ncbi:MAG: hypothetical protein JWM53_6945, partial [bacterium]|nr:hypothetical protein [bacterium]
MADDENSQRDELDAALTARLRAVRPSAAVPESGADEPSDDELLRYVDGSMDDRERESLELRLAEHPSAAARVAIVAEALAESGWGPLTKSDPVGRRAVTLASRFVFRLSDGVLSFLRGTDLPRGLEPAMAVRSSAPAQPQSFFEFVSQYPFESGEVDARLSLEPVAKQAIDVQIEVMQAG